MVKAIGSAYLQWSDKTGLVILKIMNRPKIIQPGQSYTFSKYFELPFSPEDILAELGC